MEKVAGTNRLRRFVLRVIAPVWLAGVLLTAPALAPAAKSKTRNKATPQTSTARAAQALAEARSKVLSAKPLAMYYYVGDKRGQASVLAHASRMTVIAPQCYWVERDGVVRGALPPQVVQAARRSHAAVMPLLFNRDFRREDVTSLLHNPTAQERAVSEMGRLAARDQLVGFQIDLEDIDPKDRELFSAFVRRAAERMHQEGRLLSVTLVPRFTDVPPAPEIPGHATMGQWAAAYDYHALGEAADFVTLMAYDHFNRSTPAGPIAGYEWVEKALDYALARIPPDKVLLGIALYGREWTDWGHRRFSRSLDAKQVRVLRAHWKTTPQWNARWQSPWFELRHGRATRTVWYEDARSWRAKLDLIGKDHLRGFAAWRLGFEGPDFWRMADIAPPAVRKRATRSARAARRSKPAAAKTERSQTVRAARDQ